jgi:cardiolipin synthase
VLHCKTAIIDDRWATVGSTNFDIISFFHNREANIIITDKEAVAELKAQFFRDMENAVELTHMQWEKVPLWKKAAGFAVRAIKVFFG